MVKNSKIAWIYVLFLLLAATSCKTLKVATIEKNAVSPELIYTSLNIPKTTFTFVQKQNSTGVNGSIRIKKDSIIVLSFQPFLGLEVARAGITRQSLTIIDRINKRYFQMDFDSLRASTGVDINYHTLQSIFTNSLFIYNHPEQVSVMDFKKVQVGDLSLLQATTNGIVQEFNVNEAMRVLSGRAFANNEPYSISWNYQNFMPLENDYSFPHAVKMLAKDGHNQFGLDLTYNKVELNKDVNFQFSVPSSYSQVSLEELLKMFQ